MMALPVPQFQHFLEPMYVPVDDEGNETKIHICYWCTPEFFATLAPGYTLCSRCGVVILTGDEDDPRNEAMVLCDPCEVAVYEELDEDNAR